MYKKPKNLFLKTVNHCKDGILTFFKPNFQRLLAWSSGFIQYSFLFFVCKGASSNLVGDKFLFFSSSFLFFFLLVFFFKTLFSFSINFVLIRWLNFQVVKNEKWYSNAIGRSAFKHRSQFIFFTDRHIRCSSKPI